jgi:hypothetical protein
MDGIHPTTQTNAVISTPTQTNAVISTPTQTNTVISTPTQTNAVISTQSLSHQTTTSTGVLQEGTLTLVQLFIYYVNTIFSKYIPGTHSLYAFAGDLVILCVAESTSHLETRTQRSLNAVLNMKLHTFNCKSLANSYQTPTPPPNAWPKIDPFHTPLKTIKSTKPALATYSKEPRKWLTPTTSLMIRLRTGHARINYWLKRIQPFFWFFAPPRGLQSYNQGSWQESL